VLHEPDLHEVCGFMTHDEAAILYHVAKACPEVWLEIGSFAGWSAAHIAVAGRPVLAVDPEYARETAIRTRARENFARAGVSDSVTTVGQTSEEFFELRGSSFAGVFGGIHIDGNHDAPQPLLDAQRALHMLAPQGAIVFHDYAGQPVRDAVDWLVVQGLRSKIYHTPAMVAVCWRGELALPDHTPDPQCTRGTR
jgi:predicted O-methyltransferase YrrM